MIFDQAYKTFYKNFVTFQRNAVAGAIGGTSKEELYQKLDFEPLQHDVSFVNFALSIKFSKISAL